MTGPRIGAHVDPVDPVAEAEQRSADVAQIFLGDPQGWADPVVAHPGGVDGLRDAAAAAGLDLVVHAPYRINVATTNNRVRVPSRKLLQKHVDAAAAIGALGLVVHGGHVPDGDDPAVGFANWRKAFEQLELRLPVLIENTAGGERAMARRVEDVARLWDAVGPVDGADRIGFCLDTCHAHAGGNELATVVDRVLAVTGRIDLVHANDSKDEFDSGRDRHEHLGAGRIDPHDLVGVVRAAGAPVVVETKGGAAGQGADIDWLRERLGG